MRDLQIIYHQEKFIHNNILQCTYIYIPLRDEPKDNFYDK